MHAFNNNSYNIIRFQKKIKFHTAYNQTLHVLQTNFKLDEIVLHYPNLYSIESK